MSGEIDDAFDVLGRLMFEADTEEVLDILTAAQWHTCRPEKLEYWSVKYGKSTVSDAA